MTVRPRSLLPIAAVPPPCQPRRPRLAPPPPAGGSLLPGSNCSCQRCVDCLLLPLLANPAPFACTLSHLLMGLLSRSAGLLQAASCTRPPQQPPQPQVRWRRSAPLQVRSTLIDRVTPPAAHVTMLPLILSALAPAGTTSTSTYTPTPAFTTVSPVGGTATPQPLLPGLLPPPPVRCARWVLALAGNAPRYRHLLSP